MSQYKTLIGASNIDAKYLAANELSEDLLVDLGIQSKIHRKKIIVAAQEAFNPPSKQVEQPSKPQPANGMHVNYLDHCDNRLRICSTTAATAACN